MLSADKIKMNILFLIGCRSELSCSNVDQISVFFVVFVCTNLDGKIPFIWCLDFCGINPMGLG